MNLLFPKKEMLVFLIIIGIMNIVGILRKKTISNKGRWPTFLTNDAIKAKDSAASMFNKIPAL
jgi:energy-converting hydrogenase Eha subunit F